MTFSVPAADLVRAWVREHYAFPEPVECSLLSSGFNDVFAVTAGGRKYSLRVARRDFRSREDFEHEVLAVDHLAAKGVPVAGVVRLRDGGAVGSLEDSGKSRHTIMFEWLPGEQVGAADERQCLEIGRLAGTIHRATDDLPADRLGTSVGTRWLEEDPGSAIARVVPDPSDAGLIRSVVARAQAMYAGWPKTRPFWGFVHADLAEHNVLFDEGVLRVFDFEGCGVGWRVEDVYGFLLRLGNRGLAEEAWKTRCEAFLSGYRETRKLEAFEVDAYPVHAALGVVGTMDLTVRLVPEAPVTKLCETFLPRLREMAASGFPNDLLLKGVRFSV